MENLAAGYIRIQIDAIKNATHKALLIQYDGECTQWIPKSVCKVQREGQLICLDILEWFYNENF